MDDDDGLGCCCGCCLLCCSCAATAIFNWFTFLLVLVAAAVLIAAFAVAIPVRVTVTDATLSRLHVAVNTSNGTTVDAAASVVFVAYNISLTVHLQNRNWAMRSELTAPLDAELRFAGRRFDGARLADAGRNVPPRATEEFRVLAATPGPDGVLFGGAEAAAELARERAEGVFEVELRIVGKIKYRPVHAGRSRTLEATCPLKLLVPNAPPGTHHLVVVQKDVSCY